MKQPGDAAAKPARDKTARGNASQFYVAAELCRRGHAAVVTLGNTPNTDVLCSNREGTRFVHIQVKTFVPGRATCAVGKKAEKTFGENFFWVLAGIPAPDSTDAFVYYVVPSADMAAQVGAYHRRWLAALGRNGQAHRDNDVRAVSIPPASRAYHWSIEGYEGRWDLIEAALADTSGVVVTPDIHVQPDDAVPRVARRSRRADRVRSDD